MTSLNNASRHIEFFAGSFDPFTRGHQSIVLRSLSLFDEVVIGIGINPAKSAMMTVEQRMEWIESVFHNYPQVSVVNYSGLTVDAARQAGAVCLIRGVRGADDLAYEQQVADYNRKATGIETVFLPALPEEEEISSTLLRSLIRQHKDVKHLLPHNYPQHVADALFAKFAPIENV